MKISKVFFKEGCVFRRKKLLSVKNSKVMELVNNVWKITSWSMVNVSTIRDKSLTVVFLLSVVIKPNLCVSSAKMNLLSLKIRPSVMILLV